MAEEKERAESSVGTPDEAANGVDSQNEKRPLNKVKAPAETVPLHKLWRFASKSDLVMIAVASLFSIGIGALFSCFFLAMEPLLSSLQNVQNPAYLSTHNIIDEIMPTIWIIVSFGVLQVFCGYICQMFWVLTGENQTKRIRQAYVQSVLRQNLGWFDVCEDGSLTTHLARDTELIQQGISENVGAILQSVAQLTAGIVVAFWKSWRMSLVMLACLPTLAASGFFLVRATVKHTGSGQAAYAGAGAVVEQAVSGIRTVYSFSLQKRFQHKYEKEILKAEANEAQKGKAIGLGLGCILCTMFCTYGLAFWYGSRLVVDGLMAPTSVMVVFFSLLIGCMGLISLPQNISYLGSARGAAQKIFETIDRVPKIDWLSNNGAKPAFVDGDLEFQDVHFHYPSRPDIPILRGLNLKIKKGTTVAFVGASGCGKSTSIALIQRFYDPISGIVRLDGHDVKDLNVKWLRQQIGVVSQEPVLFNATIKENILMGATRDVTENELIEACKQANCYAFISALPKSFETMVGERGAMMSGGQKQRIAIARALIRDPKILLLDEATSALDTASERIVQAALDKISGSRTTVVVAHRLSTVRHANQIVVMKDGFPVERGTHDELIGLRGVYFDLVEKQKIKMQEEDQEVDVAELELREVAEAKALGLERGDRAMPSVAVAEATSETTGIKETLLRLDDAATIIARQKRLRKQSAKQDKIIARSSKAYDAVGKVVQLMRPEWPILAVGVAGAAVSGCIFPVFSYALGSVVTVLLQDQSQIDSGPFQGANLYSFIFVLVGIASLLSNFTQIYAFHLAAAKFVKRLRAQMFAALMKQEIGYFDHEDNSLGAVTSRLATDSGAVSDLVTRVWGDVAQLIFTCICGLAIAFWQAWNLTLIILCVVPFLVAATAYEARIHRGFESESKKAYEKSGEVAAEAFKEIRTVASLTREQYFQEKYAAAIHNPHRLALRKAYLSSIGHGANSGFQMFANVIGFYAGFMLLAAGNLKAENLYACVMAVTVTAQSVGRQSTFTSFILKGKIAAVKTFELLFRESSIDPEKDGERPLHLDGSFEFKDVAFAYPSRPDHKVFTGEFNLSGKMNQNIALVGPSGCGKSTTIGMLERFYDSVAGVVSVDSKDVKSYHLIEGLRRHIALVGQEPTLFDMSIRENIMWGSDRDFVPDEEIVEAAKMANIYDFVMSLPKGFETRVGDGGSQLSGGQKQRVAIARALIRKPSILLLDEATSALDSESEKLVQEAIDKAVGQRSRTVITIAHRLSTIQDADLIAVVKDGHVVESGTHFHLLDLNGVYADLVKQQTLDIIQ